MHSTSRFAQYPRALSSVEPPTFLVRYANLHETLCEDRYRIGRHRHGNYEIILVEQGAYRCVLNDTDLELAAGDVLTLKPGDWHEDVCGPGLRYLALTFELHPGPEPHLSANVFDGGCRAQDQVLRRDTGALFALAQRLRSEGGPSDDPFTSQLQDTLATEFLWRLLRALPREAVRADLLASVVDSGFAGALMRLFRHRATERLSLDQMADELGMSRRTLTAACARTFRMSPAKMFLRYKVERARSLLRQTSLPIAQISDHLGFADPFHFSKVYRRFLSVPPSSERRTARADADGA